MQTPPDGAPFHRRRYGFHPDFSGAASATYVDAGLEEVRSRPSRAPRDDEAISLAIAEQDDDASKGHRRSVSCTRRCCLLALLFVSLCAGVAGAAAGAFSGRSGVPLPLFGVLHRIAK